MHGEELRQAAAAVGIEAAVPAGDSCSGDSLYRLVGSGGQGAGEDAGDPDAVGHGAQHRLRLAEPPGPRMRPQQQIGELVARGQGQRDVAGAVRERPQRRPMPIRAKGRFRLIGRAMPKRSTTRRLVIV